MSNPKLSKIISDAVDAPVGSTKKARAKSILSILKKTNPNKIYLGNDGQGGPLDNLSYSPSIGGNYIQPSAQQSNTPTPTPTGTTANIFSSAWDEVKNIGSDIVDWASKPQTNTVVFPASPTFKSMIPNATSASLSDVANNVVSIFSNSVTGSKTSPSLINFPNLSKIDTVPKPVIGMSPYTPVKSTTQGISGTSGAPIMSSGISGASGTTTDKTVTKPDGTTIKTTSTQTTPDPTKTGTGSGSSIYSSSGSSEKITTKGPAETSGKLTGTPPVKGSTSMSLADLKSNAKYYVDNFLGADMYAQDMLQNMGVKTPTEANAELAESLKDDYNLTALLEERTKLADATPGAVQDMTDYVKGRDQFVSKINNLMDKSNAMASGMDMTNPDNINMVNSYQQYLSVLKGRQNQQYGTYIDKSITNLKNDLNKIDDQYQNALSLYNSAYKTGAEMNKDSYDNAKKALTDMYDALADAPQKLLNLQKSQLQVLKLQEDNANGSSSTIKPWIPEQNAYRDMMIDESSSNKGNLLPDLNLVGTMNKIAGSGNNYNPLGVLDLYNTGVSKTMDSLNSEGDISGALFNSADYLDQVINFKNQFNPNDSIDRQSLDALTPTLIGIGNTAINKAGEGVNKYVLSNYNSINNAIKSLDKSGGKIDINSWTKSNSGVDSTLLKKIQKGYGEYMTSLSGTADNSIYDSGLTIQSQVKAMMANDPTITKESALARISQDIIIDYDKKAYESNF